MKQGTFKMESVTIITIQELAKLLECPVCYSNIEMESTIQCMNGHHGCDDCFSVLETCPVCRVEMSKRIKSFSVETIEAVKRELRHFETNNLSFDANKLLDIFKCDLCHEISTNRPIRQCSNGHIECDFCETISPKPCPICGSMLDSSQTRRSLLTEKIISKFPKPCRYQHLGCKQILSEFEDHELQECCVRPLLSYFLMFSLIVPTKEYSSQFTKRNPNHFKLETTHDLGKICNFKSGSINLPGYYCKGPLVSPKNILEVLQLQLHENENVAILLL